MAANLPISGIRYKATGLRSEDSDTPTLSLTPRVRLLLTPYTLHLIPFTGLFIAHSSKRLAARDRYGAAALHRLFSNYTIENLEPTKDTERRL